MAVLFTLPVSEKNKCKPQRQDYARRVFPDEQAVGLSHTATTTDMGKTTNVKWQHRCLEYLLGTREYRLLLFPDREICSHLYSEREHLHPDAAHCFHVKNMVYSKIH